MQLRVNATKNLIAVTLLQQSLGFARNRRRGVGRERVKNTNRLRDLSIFFELSSCSLWLLVEGNRAFGDAHVFVCTFNLYCFSLYDLVMAQYERNNL